MSRKTSILSLAVGGVCCFGVSKASAQNTLLPGNIWPNPDLSQSVQSSQATHTNTFGNLDEANGVDQVYSFYNAPFYTPDAAGTSDANPRPNGWHRGGSDFNTTTTPNFCFYNTPNGSAVNGAEGNAPAGTSSGYALLVSDDSTGGYGEWFSDWNPLGSAIIAANGGTLQFWYEDSTPSNAPRDNQLRVTIDFDAMASDEISTANTPTLGHIDTTFNFGSANVGTWTEVDVPLGALPAGTEAAKITLDSGGGSDTLGDLWVSDISVAVPEPASIGIITAGSMLLLAKRRRAKATV
jgi:hypothetical protein